MCPGGGAQDLMSPFYSSPPDIRRDLTFCALVPLFLTSLSIFSTTVTHLKMKAVCEERDGDLGDMLLQKPDQTLWGLLEG